MSGRRSRASPFAAYLLPGGFYHARPASSLVPHSSLVPRLFSPPRRHLFSRAVFGSSSIHAVIAPAGRPAKRHPPLTHQGIASGYPHHNAPFLSTSTTRRETGRWDGVRFSFVAHAPRSPWPHCPVLSSWSRRISPAGFPPRGGGNSGGAYIPRRFPQLISSAPRPAVSIRVSKQDGVAVLGPVIVSPPRLVIASSRPSCRRAGRRASRPPSAGSVSGPVSTAPEDMATARPRSHHNKQAGRAARPRPAPSCRAGGEFLMVSSSARMASKQSGGLVSSRPLCPHPGSSPHRLIRLVPRVGQRGGIVSTPRLVPRVGGGGRSAVSGSSSVFAFHEKGGGFVSPSPRLGSVLLWLGF